MPVQFEAIPFDALRNALDARLRALYQNAANAFAVIVLGLGGWGWHEAGVFIYPKVFPERRKDMAATDIWHDPVWSAVIAGTIVAIVTAIATQLKFNWVTRISDLWAIKLSVTNAYTSSQPGAGYPLKYYVEMRNDSQRCIAVRVLRYDSKSISVKSFPPEVIQVRFNTSWYPSNPSAEAVALLPRQLCRAWLGVDERIFTEAQVNAAKGKIGTFSVLANKKQFSFEL